MNGSPETALPLENLSWKITKNASIVSHYLESNHLQQPSLSSDGLSTILPIETPCNIQQARQNLISASLELLQLAICPSEFLPNLALGFQYIACLEWLFQYKIFHLITLHARISYSKLATAAKVPEQRLKSITRMAMTNTLFLEQPDGKHVSHSATSALLASNEDFYAYATYMFAESAPMVGGSTGGAAKELAKAYPHLNFVVEDLPENAEIGRQAAYLLPSEISSRLTFQRHNLMEPQPVQGADIYYLRMILHDWLDAEASKIINNVVAAMENKPNSRLLIMDTVLPVPSSIPVSVERIVRVRDLTMMQAFNGKERSLDDCKGLLAITDPRLQLVSVFQLFGSAISVLEVAVGHS